MKSVFKKVIKSLGRVNAHLTQLATIIYYCRRIIGTVVFVVVMIQSTIADLEQMQLMLGALI